MYFCSIATYNYTIHKQIYAEHNQTKRRTSMNERTHFFIKIYVDVGCVWEVSSRRGQTATYWPQVLLTIAAPLSHSGWAAQPWVIEGPKPSAAGSQFGILSPTGSNSNWNWLKPSVYWLYFCLAPTGFRFFRLFTQVHLLIDGSVEGQYVTLCFLFQHKSLLFIEWIIYFYLT